MPEKFEKLVKTVYRKSKKDSSVKNGPHPGEEDLVCFSEGRLTKEETESIKLHLICCEVCAENFLTQARIEKCEELSLPAELVSKVKALLPEEKNPQVLVILISMREKLIELLNTNGDVLVGQELMPAPILRTRKIKNFKDEITILKDFANIRVEIKIEYKHSAAFSLTLLVKDKNTSSSIKDLRIALLKEGMELESYVTDSGKAVFDNVQLGKYTIEITSIDNRFASVSLEVKT